MQKNLKYLGAINSIKSVMILKKIFWDLIDTQFDRHNSCNIIYKSQVSKSK